jgi:regulator of PEP synthase PpsR (kinase-PPPase family)
LLSDSTGNLAQHMVTALLTQFPPRSVEVRRHPFLHSTARIAEALASLTSEPGMVMHSVVQPEHKEQIRARCEALGLPVCDLTEPFLQFMRDHTGLEPSRDLARLHDTGDDYRRRIEAVEFTLAHDDGLGLSSISRADVVLTGISRTSKTPTSIYLAEKGFKVANVSLAMELEPPAELLALGRERVVGFVIDAARLVDIRTQRRKAWHVGQTSYEALAHVEQELAFSRALFMRQGWPTLDVTHLAVEETAAKVIALLSLSEQ